MKEISPGGKEKKEELKCPDNYTASRGDLWQAGSSAASAPPPPPPSPSSPGPAGGGGSEPSHTGPSPPPAVPSISARPPTLDWAPGWCPCRAHPGITIPRLPPNRAPSQSPLPGTLQAPSSPVGPSLLFTGPLPRVPVAPSRGIGSHRCLLWAAGHLGQNGPKSSAWHRAGSWGTFYE